MRLEVEGETNIALCLDDGTALFLDAMKFSYGTGDLSGWVPDGGLRVERADLPDAPEPRLSPMGASPTFEPLLVERARDGSQLVLGVQFATAEHPLRLVFQHEGNDLEPLTLAPLQVRYVTLGDDRKFLVLLGDNCDEPRAECVVLETPYAVGTSCPLLKPRHHRAVWMHYEPFKPGPVTAWWKRGDEILHKIETPPLKWGMVWPPLDS